MGLRSIVVLGAAALTCCAASGFAQDKAAEPIKIGAMGDMSGIYQGNSGPGSVAAVKLAVEDFGGKVLGRPIVVVSADHQVKPDIASAIARRWYDQEGVHVIVDAVSSGTSLAVAAIAKDRKRIFLASNAASSAFNMDQCNAYTVQWRSDTYASANAIVSSTLKSGATKWYVIAADYNFGHALQNETTQIVEAAGGKMVGGVRHPVGTNDFSSFILAAQSSGAEIVALANAGDDMVKALKSADEFGLLTSPKQKMVSMLVFITDVHALGLKTIKGLVVVSDFYWDFDDKTRTWAERYYKLMGKMPTMSHARGLLRHPPLFEGDAGGELRQGGGRHGDDAQDPGRRYVRAERQTALRQPVDPRRLSASGQGARRKQAAVGLLQGPGRHPR